MRNAVTSLRTMIHPNDRASASLAAAAEDPPPWARSPPTWRAARRDIARNGAFRPAVRRRGRAPGRTRNLRPLADKERHRVGDIGGRAGATHGDLLRGGRFEILECHAQAFGGCRRHVGLDESARDGVRRDAEPPQLARQWLGETLEPGLGGRVVHLTTVAYGGGAGQIDDAPPAGLGHMAPDRARPPGTRPADGRLPPHPS